MFWVSVFRHTHLQNDQNHWGLQHKPARVSGPATMALYLGLVVGATGLSLKIGHLPPVPANLYLFLANYMAIFMAKWCFKGFKTMTFGDIWWFPPSLHPNPSWIPRNLDFCKLMWPNLITPRATSVGYRPSPGGGWWLTYPSEKWWSESQIGSSSQLPN